MMVFWNDSQGVIDAVTEGGLGLYGGKDQEALAAQYGGPVSVISLDEAARRREAKAISPPVEIDRAEFVRCLEVLPPLKWIQPRDGTESFRICEAYSGDIHTACVRIGKRYFSMKDKLSLSHAELVAKVEAAIPTVRVQGTH